MKDFAGETCCDATAFAAGLGRLRPGSALLVLSLVLMERWASGEEGRVIGSGEVEREEYAILLCFYSSYLKIAIIRNRVSVLIARCC